MPLLPLVTGSDGSPSRPSDPLARSTTAAHSSSPAPSPGSRSRTSRSGFPGLPASENCHGGTWISKADIWAIQARVRASLTRGYTASWSLWCSRCLITQSGVPASRFFWKKLFPGAAAVPTPSTQRFRVAGGSWPTRSTWGQHAGSSRRRRPWRCQFQAKGSLRHCSAGLSRPQRPSTALLLRHSCRSSLQLGRAVLGRGGFRTHPR